ncbi:hypothetical protein [Spiroplasma endosymbiont of Danaus chrysippus]|uniref:hypothetical protein n=1 Tax=Spiroplasma endosymbiont of Danaus chrysippus TaxID=2691041 RepID=UPI0013C5709E|nr:hypothetical protein [Spiroplasma endosymbiont of Danaus chrysippus]CAB1053584.1 hypothetical protein [Spiroplasma endosymbiont of Danaus chrysippus]
MEEKENEELQTKLLKEQIELIEEQKEFYKKSWKSRIIFLTIGIIIMILTLIIIASKH